MAARRKHEPPKRQYDFLGRIIQLAAIVAVVAMVYIDQKDTGTKIDAWIYGGMLGLAFGANPDDLIQLGKMFIKYLLRK